MNAAPEAAAPAPAKPPAKKAPARAPAKAPAAELPTASKPAGRKAPARQPAASQPAAAEAPAPRAPAGRKKAADKTVATKAPATRKSTSTQATPPRQATADRKAPARRRQAAELPPAEPPAAAPPAPATPPAPPHSRIGLQGELQRRLHWAAGAECPDTLRQAALQRLDADGHLDPDDDDALPLLLRLAAETGHALEIDPAVWPQLAQRRDARQRLFEIEHAHPEGPASAALRHLLRAPLAPFQAEGALFAACAGRALLADEPGLGKTVQALAAGMLLHRHAGVQQVLVRCSVARAPTWRRELQRFLGHAAAGWRVAAGAAGPASGEAPDLVIIDEPAELPDWHAIDAPFALVLSSRVPESDTTLLNALVDFLDVHRQGPFARWLALRDGAGAADPAAIDDALSGLLLRRRRAEVAAQLPACTHAQHVLPLAPEHHALHQQAAGRAAALLAAWRRTARFTDQQQWQLGEALATMRAAARRADPAAADSALAPALLQALHAQAAQADGGGVVGVLVERAEDGAAAAAELAAAGLPAERQRVAHRAEALAGCNPVISLGVPWQLPPADGVAGRWLHLVAEGSIDAALFDTLALRHGVPAGPAEGGTQGFLHGSALQRYLLAAEAVLQAAGLQA